MDSGQVLHGRAVQLLEGSATTRTHCRHTCAELTRQLVEHLPAKIIPRWVTTRTQPIAVDDVVGYLVGLWRCRRRLAGSSRPGDAVLQYVTMLRRVAAIQGRSLPILPVPLLIPRLSSLWLTLVTDVDLATGPARPSTR